MEMEKIVNLDNVELSQREREAAEQVFRIRFQMRMGQNEGLKKLREFKKDIARIKTVQRQRALGAAAAPGSSVEAEPATAGAKAAGKKPARAKSSAKVSGKAKAAGKVKPTGRGKANAKKEARKLNDGI